MKKRKRQAKERYTIVGLGEILWDLLPGGKQLGGAPGNFAFHVHALGDDAVIASRVGKDQLGNEVRSHLAQVQLDDTYLQDDDDYPTGTVEVIVGDDGQPEYNIHQPAAWDYMAWTAEWRELAQRSDAVCFGSLGQRQEQSRRTIREFLEAMRPGALRVFDVNLRQSYYSVEVLEASLRRADIVKLNEAELARVGELLGQAGRDVSESARRLMGAYELELLCLTRGANGCVLVTAEQTAEHPGYPGAVADTVGAGDAFTAALVYHFLRGTGLPAIARAANRLGAWVTTQPGGTAQPDVAVIRSVTSGEM